MLPQSIRSLGCAGIGLFVLLAFCIGGCIGTIATAGLWVIPLVGILALPFLPFPTLILYVAATLALYLGLAFLVIWSGRRLGWLWQSLSLGLAFAVVLAIAWAMPLSWNRAAGVDAPAPARNWQPLRLPQGASIALISEWNPYRDDMECDAFCLALLVSGRANDVIVGRSDAWPIEWARKTRARRYRLKADWRDCFGKLPDYSMIARSNPELQRLNLRELGLSPLFQTELPKCLDAEEVPLEFRKQPSLIHWRKDADETSMAENVGFDPDFIVQQIVRGDPAQDGVRKVQSGRRYVVPVTINPFGGNAGSGGTFSPHWATSYFSNVDHERREAGWWEMVEGSDLFLTKAIEILDPIIPERDIGNDL